MRLSSKGLGKMTLPFDLAEAQIAKGEDGRVWFSGRIKKRAVRWDYRLRLDDADIVRFMALARHSPRLIVAVAALEHRQIQVLLDDLVERILERARHDLLGARNRDELVLLHVVRLVARHPHLPTTSAVRASGDTRETLIYLDARSFSTASTA